jgi:hypothetical protein
MKNLLEVGLDVTGFDKNAYVGGLWHYTEKEQISVLESEFYFPIIISYYSSGAGDLDTDR